MIIRTVLSWLIYFSLLTAQYSQEWEVPQDLYEKGILYFDVNHDSIPEITKFWWNTVTMFDGSNGFEVLWYMVDDVYENLTLWELYDFNGNSPDEALFIRSNTIDTVTTALMLVPALDQVALWTTSELAGSISFIDAKDLDQDGEEEVVFGVNRYEVTDSSYYFTLFVLNSMTGDEEWVSEELRGYITGPYLGDLDGDGVIEIMVNVYDFTGENYSLRVYGFSGEMEIQTEESLPRIFFVGYNYPNPFNPTTTIPLKIHHRTQVTIQVIDIKGREVFTLLSGELAPGQYQLTWPGIDDDGKLLPAGIYYYRVTTVSGTVARPMVLLK